MTQPSVIAVNARVTAFAMGGQQRVAHEVMKRLPAAEIVKPHQPLGGLKGHAWEQAVLPFEAKGRLLWSPSATGPLFYRHQVVTIHDTAFLDVPEYFSRAFVTFYQTLVPRLAKRVARVVTVSEYSRRQIMRATGLPSDKVDVIPNGVSEHFRPYSAADIQAMRDALSLPERYVLVQATSDRRKNLARTLEAWRQIATQLPADVHLVISGNLGRAHVFGDAGALNINGPRILTTGFVDERWMGPLMAGAELFLFPSVYEGFGLPVLEAMASGTPVITGNQTSLPEIAGNAAFLINPYDTGEIATAIRELLENPDMARDLVARGIRRASLFTWDDAAARYIALFQKIHEASLGHKLPPQTSVERVPSSSL